MTFNLSMIFLLWSLFLSPLPLFICFLYLDGGLVCILYSIVEDRGFDQFMTGQGNIEALPVCLRIPFLFFSRWFYSFPNFGLCNSMARGFLVQIVVSNTTSSTDGQEWESFSRLCNLLHGFLWCDYIPFTLVAAVSLNNIRCLVQGRENVWNLL